MADPRPRIVVAGESLIDRVIRPDGSVEEHPGGGPFNTARALGRLGCRVSFIGGISTDANGRRLRTTLEADGVDLGLARTIDRPTLIATATVNLAGVARYTFEPADSAAAGLTDATLPVDTAVLHVGTLGLVLEPAASTILGLVDRAGPAVLVMVDPNIRPSAIDDEAAYLARLARVVERADIIKASTEDADWIRSRGSFDQSVVVRESGKGGILIETAGPSFVKVTTPTAEVRFTVRPREVIDTVGAGDAFSAGFLARWVEQKVPRGRIPDSAAIASAVQYAIAVAGRTVERAGADPPWRTEMGVDDEWGR